MSRWGGELGQKTPQEAHVKETRAEKWWHAIVKPLGLSIVSGGALSLIMWIVLSSMRDLGRHSWYVLCIVWYAGCIGWYHWVVRVLDDQWTFYGLLALCILGIPWCTVSVVIDNWIARDWNIVVRLCVVLPGCVLGFITLLPANTLESWLVSPFLEYAASVLVGGHDGKYDGPYWWRRSARRPPTNTRRPVMNKGRDVEPAELPRAQVVPGEKSEIEMFLDLVKEKATLSREKLKGEILSNGNKLGKPGWYRCIGYLEEQGYVEETSTGRKWTNGNDAETALDLLLV